MHAGDAAAADDGARCPYAILGVEPHEATQQSIRRAYRALSMRFHPDKNPARDREACEEAFKRIAWAYEMIGDEDRRRQWDYGTMSARAPSAASTAHAHAHAEFRDPFEMFASVFGDDFAHFASGGARGTSMFGGAFDAPDPFFSASRAAEPSSFAFGGGFGGSMFGNSMFQSSAFAPPTSTASMFGSGSFTSTSTSTHVSADGTTVTRSVTRRTLPDGSIEETENVSTTPGGYGYDAIGAAPRGGFYY